ncbi:MAG: transketolase [Chloroflexi bacterium]|nr:transketolase [Chloroflexota bacterium]
MEHTAACVRRDILITVHGVGGGHVGGPLSAADLLTALYFHSMRIDPARPEWPDRDRFILSKGHSCLALYAVLAERGYFPREELATFDAVNSRLQGHPDMTVTPGIDMSSGSLGQGLSAGIGMALGARLLGKPSRTFVMLGDGECQEGQVWEAAFVASRYKLDNLTAILDWNSLQQYGWRASGGDDQVRQPPDEHPIPKWKAFGWHTIELDGHDMQQIVLSLEQAQAVVGKPSILIARTVKGKGVSFMQGNYLWHSRPITDVELSSALAELS